MNMKSLINYEVIEQKTLKDLQSEGYLLRHKKTGARVVLMENDDENKVFSIGFRTPTDDSTGVIKVIADCYNAAPESMAAALNVLKTCGGKRIAVLGDMLELGEHSEALHESVGKAVEGCADMLICVGEEAKYIALAAEKIMNKEDIYVYPSADYEKAAKLVAETAKEGDTVLFKASNRTNLRKVMEITAL